MCRSYAGIAFTIGRLVSPEVQMLEGTMGVQVPWLGWSGRHIHGEVGNEAES